MSYKNEIMDILCKAMEEIIKIADKHKLDRDETIKRYADLWNTAIQLGSFKNYKTSEINVNYDPDEYLYREV